jgi:predicted nucleotidyltransferase
MHPFLNTHREQISALCRRYGVRRLEVFGSASDSEHFDTARSDVDLLVEFDQSPNGSYTDQYFGLLEDLSTLLHRPVDLVVERAVRNPFFLESLRATRQLLYPAHAV